MGFSEKIKKEVKKRANFQCCMCRGLIIDVHHIIPENAGGSNSVDNAAPLCGGCHRRFGNNPDHRKTIRDMRDHWYEICEYQNFGKPPGDISINEKIDRMSGDIREVKNILSDYYKNIAHEIEKAQSLDDITASSSAVSSGTNIFVACPKCNRPMTYLGDGEYHCKNCDGPLATFIKAL